MKRLERLVVHVEEALRFAKFEDDAHRRLALILLDSAAELLMHRAVRSKLASAALRSQILTTYDGMEAAGHTLSPALEQSRQELRRQALSSTRRREIERNFDAKAEYLAGHGALSKEQARVLRKLHSYRNEAYHRDRVRAGSLVSAVQIYGYVVCELMRVLEPSGMSIFREPPPGLNGYLRERSPFGLGLQKEIAEELLRTSGVVVAEDLGLALAAHLEDRLSALFEGLGDISRFISQPGRWDESTVLVWIQLDDQYLIFDPEEVRKRPVALGMEQLRALRDRAHRVAGEGDQLAAFAEFADIEDAFEPVEQLVVKLLDDIERETQSQIDVARGK